MSQAGTIDFENSSPDIPTLFTGNVGTATPASNNINILGDSVLQSGIPVETIASGDTLTVDVQISSTSVASDATKVGLAAFDSASFAVDANGFVTFVGSGGGDLSTLTGNSGIATAVAANIDVVGGNNILTLGSAGSLVISLNGTTNHAIQIGDTSGSLNSLGVATNGQIPIGSTGSDPVLASLTGGTGITITSGAGSITISANDGGMTWTEVTGTSQTAAVDNGYIANNAGLVTVTLPAVSAVGDVVMVDGKGAGLFKIAQPNAGSVIHFLSNNTTTGVGGSLTAIERYACITLRCITANADWVVESSQGNFTIV